MRLGSLKCSQTRRVGFIFDDDRNTIESIAAIVINGPSSLSCFPRGVPHPSSK